VLTRQQKILYAIGAMVFVALVAIAFEGYFAPGMLVDFVMRLCG
jgi:hypothetical protein